MLGENLRRLRDARGVSMREVARAIDISQAYLSRLENGANSSPSSEILEKLARYHGVSIADLFNEDAVPPELHRDLARIKGLIQDDDDTEPEALNEVFAHAVKALEIAIETEKRGAELTPRQKKAILRLVLEFTENPKGG